MLNTIDITSIFVIDKSYNKQNYIPIDLSSDNSKLEKVDVSSSEELGNFINQHIKRNKALVAYGGYLEKREIYQRSTYFNGATKPEDERNIHLGVDIWQAAGTNVLAALDAEVHSFKNNTNYGDYGPTIILKHAIEDFSFYTLYGHLSVSSLTSLEVGQKFKKGEVIAQLGKAKVNGDYPPHLHFQIILNIEDYQGDYPGVSSLNTLEFYRKNCPNPNLLLGLA